MHIYKSIKAFSLKCWDGIAKSKSQYADKQRPGRMALETRCSMKQRQRMMAYSNNNMGPNLIIKDAGGGMSSSSVFASYCTCFSKSFSLYAPCKCRCVRVPPCLKHTRIMRKWHSSIVFSSATHPGRNLYTWPKALHIGIRSCVM